MPIEKKTRLSAKIDIRLTDQEREILERKSKEEGIKKGEYVRLLLRNQERVFTFSEEQLKALKEEFRKLSLLGSNINQIAKRLNANFDRIDLERDMLFVKLEEVRKEVSRLEEALLYFIKAHRRT